MLNKLIIKDFQSHKNSTLEFHEGVNVIVGNSDCGKSAILRALSWAILNKCDDSSFMRTGAKEVSVELEFDEAVVTRKRNSSGNIYLLDKQEFKAFKQEIPADVADVLNMNEINIQTQLEPPFLLSQSGGEVAKTLNKMVDLSVIHESISEIKKRVLQNSRDIEDTKKQAIENEELLGSFKFIPSLEKKVKAYEVLCKEKIEVETGIQELSRAISRYQNQLDRIDSFEELMRDEEKVENTVKNVVMYRTIGEQIKKIASLVDDISGNQSMYEAMTEVIKLEPKVKNAIELVKLISKISDEVRIAERYESVVYKLMGSLDRNEKEYIESIGKVCPLCEQPIQDDEIPY